MRHNLQSEANASYLAEFDPALLVKWERGVFYKCEFIEKVPPKRAGFDSRVQLMSAVLPKLCVH